MRGWVLMAALLLCGCDRDIDGAARRLLKPRVANIDTAKFRNLRKSAVADDGDYIVCGEVSAKDASGTYGTFVQFAADGPHGGVSLADDGVSAQVLSQMGSSMCDAYPNVVSASLSLNSGSSTPNVVT